MATVPRGISFPLRFGPLGHLERSGGKDKIKNNIRSVILQEYGQREVNDNFGSVSLASMFRQIDYSLVVLIRDLITESLARHEDRIDSVQIDAEEIEDEDGDGKLQVWVRYRVVDTGEFDDLVQILGE